VRWRVLLAATLMLGAAYLVKALLETRTVAVKVGNRLYEHTTLAPFDITLTVTRTCRGAWTWPAKQVRRDPNE
jgi:hypothetical protein